MLDFEYQKRLLILTKTLLYFATMTYVEYVIISHFDVDKKSATTKHSKLTSILLYEVMVFFLGITSLVLFLVFSRFLSFKTIRERLGFGGQMRYSTDFLEWVGDDVHWMQNTLTIICLFFYVLTKRKDLNEWITLQITELYFVIALFIVDSVNVYLVFLAKDIRKKFITVSIVLSLVLNLTLIVMFMIDFRVEVSLYWQPFLLFLLSYHCMAAI